MAPLQYAIYLMKSCFTNRPLSKVEISILKNIFEIGSAEVVLLGEALWKMANSLSKILPFSSELTNQFCPFWRFEQKFLLCRTLYENSAANDTLRFREKINKDILLFLSMNYRKNTKKI